MTLSYGFSHWNSGEWTPTMVSPSFSYLACQSRNCGITFLQLYHPKVQNSTNTTRPRNFSMLSGSLLIQGPPVISGAGWPTRSPIAGAGAAAPSSPAVTTTAAARDLRCMAASRRQCTKSRFLQPSLGAAPRSAPWRYRRDWFARRRPPIMESAWGWAWARPEALAPWQYPRGKGRDRMAGDDRKLAMFIDFENIVRGVKEAQYKQFEIKLVLERLVEKGKIMVKRAYADWNRYAEYKRPFHEHDIELIDVPQSRYSGKNSADIRMVVDAMDLAYAKQHVDSFALVSGDSDFSPLVSKLRGLPEKKAEAFAQLIEAVLALQRENKDTLWGSMVKQTMIRKNPAFSESYYGYSTFSKLLEEAAKQKILTLEKDARSGTYIITSIEEGRAA